MADLSPTDASDPWARARMAVTLLAIDPKGLGGLWLRARAGPLRDRLTAAFDALPAPRNRLHPTIGDDALFGGLDLTATLAAGRPVQTTGLLNASGTLLLTMAERCTTGLAARLATAMDRGCGPLVALDEAADPDEGLASALSDRLGLFVDLDGIAWSDSADLALDHDAIATARDALPKVRLPAKALVRLTATAAMLAISSMRAPVLAIAAARAHAALAGRHRVNDDDLRAAVVAVYGHRAAPLADVPPDAPAPPPDTPPDNAPDTDTERPTEQDRLPDEILVEAARAALPDGLLAELAAGAANRAAKGASGTGAERAGNRRGRPLPSRPGKLGTGARLDLVGTLRQAAPWQPMRRAQMNRPDATLLVRPADIRLKRFREMSDRVLVFAVDTSGSAAFARLAEAKGAVELLLAQAYSRRDHVALLAFRGQVAELILPPTRSLVQTKRRLAGLPGGGGTPLAAGLQMAMVTALQARKRGLTPTIALLTDGRGNIALDGTSNRAQAEADTQAVARLIRSCGLPMVVIDSAARPQASLQALARDMAAPYLALPRADAHRLSVALSGALGG